MLAQMSRVTETIYLHELQKVQSILKEENVLRGGLARLAALSKPPQDPQSQIETMQAIGADVLWQGWVARTRRQLNMELAHVMAQKLARIDRVRQSFGRKQAVLSLHEQEVKNLRRRANLKRENA
jgi:hypothetical protein